MTRQIMTKFIRQRQTGTNNKLHIKLEGAHESAYLRQVLAFNAEKFRGSCDPGHAPFWENFWGSRPDCPWEYVCQIWSL